MTDRSDAARRARGLRLVKAWLPEESSRKLDALLADSGYTVTEFVVALIDSDYAEWQEMLTARASRKPGSAPRASATK